MVSCKDMVNLDFSADVNTANTILLAIKYANDFTIQHSGITRDGSLVTTKECVDYRIKKNDLLLSFDGGWRIFKTDTSMEWVPGHNVIITYYKEVNKAALFEFLNRFDDSDLTYKESKDAILGGVHDFNVLNNTNFDPLQMWEEYINRE